MRPEQRCTTAVIVASSGSWREAAARILVDLGIDLVGTEADARGLPDLAASKHPALVVLGLDSQQDEVALECLRETLRNDPDTKAVVFGDAADHGRLEAAFAAGARAYVATQATSDDIASAIRQVFAKSIHFRVFNDGATRSSHEALDPPLTEREVEVLSLIAEGRTNAEVAKALFVTEQTVKFHLSNIYGKLNVGNRTQASRWAHLHGIAPHTR